MQHKREKWLCVRGGRIQYRKSQEETTFPDSRVTHNEELEQIISLNSVRVLLGTPGNTYALIVLLSADRSGGPSSVSRRNAKNQRKFRVVRGGNNDKEARLVWLPLSLLLPQPILSMRKGLSLNHADRLASSLSWPAKKRVHGNPICDLKMFRLRRKHSQKQPLGAVVVCLLARAVCSQRPQLFEQPRALFSPL